MITQQHGFEIWSIYSPSGKSCMRFVPAKGAVACSLQLTCRQQTHELLYLHDNFWEASYDDLIGGWPFLFPICARLERNQQSGVYLYAGKTYQLPIHGFAPYLPWEVIPSQQTDSISFVLRDNQQTYQQYPFKFEVMLRYQIEEASIRCSQRITNLDDKVMPYYAGFHPYFFIPVDKSLARLHYQPQTRYQYNARLTDIVGSEALTQQTSILSAPSLNEQLCLLHPDAAPIQLELPEYTLNLQTHGSSADENLYPYLQTYHNAAQAFFCIEPWMSFPNAMNSVLGARYLPAKASDTGTLHLWLG
jgi:galactose mutarotase-like enzyme